jgi:cobalt-precorrin 5A hydrolase/precorrin-3B C17-methyltransferase
MSATLYGLGIGPGDPDLVTVKARHILQTAPVIAYPAPEGGTSLVRAIADPHIPEGRTEIVISTPMVAESFPAGDVYDRYGEMIAAHLDQGRDVAVLCEGDPFLYGSFMYLFERISGRYPTEVVPGVSSLGAVAAVAGTPLVSRNEVLTILPATLPEGELETRLAATDTAAIMKVGRHLSKVRRVLRRLDLNRQARYVERATMRDQRVVALDDLAEDSAPYFSMILVRHPEGRRGRGRADVSRLPTGAALVALGAGGMDLARRLKAVLPESRIHGLASRTEHSDVAFCETMAHLRALFSEGVPIVAVCAAGIVIRALAPLLRDKQGEPPVVCVAENGSSAIPLLGGHHGANRLARAIAASTGGTAAITTGGDIRFGLSLDDPPPGWRIANPPAVKDVTAALLAGVPVALRVEAGDARWLTESDIPFSEHGEHAVWVTDRMDEDMGAALVLHPPVLAVGVGCERGASPEEVTELVLRTLAAHRLAPGAVACVASIDLKADEAAVHAVADALGVPARFFTAGELNAEAPRLRNPSEVVFREVGCPGVAEGAALAAGGAAAALIVEKTRSRRATCAVARAPGSIDPATVGRPRGSLTVVGIGPGNAAWRTPDASRVLAEATDVVGYGLYLDLIADAISGKNRHMSNLSQEEDRVRRAFELAAEGRSVALVSSGDAGVYGLAALAFEVLDHDDNPAWNRVAVSVTPGVSAFQAAASRIGAPTGHDFCAISLSDLLTPWPRIERRLKAAADGDFVVAFYNPVSKRRQTHLATARDILLTGRPPHTPVVLARNLGRDGERIEVIRLDELEPERADMLTMVLVGNSQSRVVHRGVNRWVYTPRGYAKKHEDPAGSASEKETSR